MQAVRILNDQVVNQIAAGEVVERPASVVKELVENSLDAEASEITVIISNGGQSSIEVIDNGLGLNKNNALLAIERFGTSKISSAEDLEKIDSFGFRGEALPSIAAVSKFSLSSAPREGDVQSGVELSISGGKLQNVKELSSQKGTRITVRNLFFNTPARKRFLKTERTETSLIKSLLQDFSIAKPEVRFKLIVDGKETLNLSPTKGFFERVAQIKKNLVDAIRIDFQKETDFGPISVKGYLSKPAQTVSSSNNLRFLVNGRSVRESLLISAVRQGYGFFLKPGRYPSGYLDITLSASEVDVNVHPQKSEVRFRKSDLVFSAIQQAVRAALDSVELQHITREDEDGESLSAGVELPVGRDLSFDEGQASYQPGESNRELFVAEEKVQYLAEVQAQAQRKLSQMRFLGQIFHCYLLMEGQGVFAIVDMHAAHERAVFYRLKKQMLDGAVSKQLLLVPEVIELSGEKLEKFRSVREKLVKLGFESEEFSEDSVVIRSYPANLHNVSYKELLTDLLSHSDWFDCSAEIDRTWDEVISRIACHGSVRSGRDLEREEVYALLEDLESAESSAFCPHGRPVVKYYTEHEIEQMFGRVV